MSVRRSVLLLLAVTSALTLASTTDVFASSPGQPGGGSGGSGGTGGHEAGVFVTANALALVEGQQGPPNIGSFVDPDGTATEIQYSANVEWGDGASGPAQIIRTNAAPSSPARFALFAAHAYHYNGTFRFCVTVNDVDNQNRSEACAMATTQEAPVSVNGVTGASTNPYCDAAATIKDSNPYGWAGDFGATIDWGDGTTSWGNIVYLSPGKFAVGGGCHTYAQLGPHTLTMSVVDESTPVATVTSTAWIYAMTDGGSFVIGDRNAAVGSGVTLWGSGWSSANNLSGGAVPASFKGFAPGAGKICAGSWTAGPGGSSKPPTTVPSYTAVLVSSSITKDASKIDGNSIHVALVRTDPGYGPSPDQAGTGAVAYMIC